MTSHRNTRPAEKEDGADAAADLSHDAQLSGAFLSTLFVPTAGVWHGYIEWERQPHLAELAHKILAAHTWPPPPEYQLRPLPETNPILEGERWKQWHAALGPALADIPAESWAIVKQEKAEDMLAVLDFPYNGEPRRDKLMLSHITPNQHHFVRNHGGIPTLVDEAAYRLEGGGLVARPGSISLAELKDETLFQQVEMTVTLQCSGTRRIEQIDYAPGEGDEMINAPWAEGAIGTAVYRGVKLTKLLKHFGGVIEPGQHIEATGADTYFKKNNVSNYKVSVGLRLAKLNEAIVVWEMNGVPLPRIHGAPLRLIVPGVIGARSCKWLLRLTVLADPSMGPVQQQEYLYYNSQVGKHNASFSKGFSIQDMPVSSAMLSPAHMAVITHDGTIDCAGWAYTGGADGWIERVEVSSDGGFTWWEATDLSPKHYHAKRLWRISLPVIAEGWLELVVRAWDSRINTQPTYVRSAWNWGLHVTSSAHRVKIYSADRSNPATAARLKQLAEHGDSLERITRPIEFLAESANDYAEAIKQKGPREPLN